MAAPEGDPPEREYIVPPEAMVDVTQSIACIQCGACVSSCLSMEADPDFIGPAALAKAYRFVGDPRDGQTTERLYDLAKDPHGIYDCTHCFSCIDACPKGVAPMDQIMRLAPGRRREDIEDATTAAATSWPSSRSSRRRGRSTSRCSCRSRFAPGIKGKLMPKHGAIKGLLESIPTAIRGIRTGKMRSLPKLIPGVHHKLPGDAQDHVKRIYEHAEEQAIELNLYIIGEEADEEESSRRPEAVRRASDRARARREGRSVKLAYWPGCVSRGFTPELHGSMGLVAERLGIELVTLDRANCCGAGVIAEHNQELADTLNARTFALAQQTGLAMMNICSTCQGAQSECQQRLDADSAYRAHINETLAERGPLLRRRPRTA